MLIFEERGKPLGAEQIPNNQLNPLVAEPGPRRWEAIAINTTPSLLPLDHGAKVRNRLFKNNFQQQKRRRREWISMMAMIMMMMITLPNGIMMTMITKMMIADNRCDKDDNNGFCKLTGE